MKDKEDNVKDKVVAKPQFFKSEDILNHFKNTPSELVRHVNMSLISGRQINADCIKLFLEIMGHPKSVIDAIPKPPNNFGSVSNIPGVPISDIEKLVTLGKKRFSHESGAIPNYA